MSRTVVVNNISSNVKVVSGTNSRTINADITDNAVNVTAQTHAQPQIDAEINGPTSSVLIHEHLQEEIDTKQNLGYLVLDAYILNPTNGVITDNKDLEKLNKYLVNKVSVSTNIYYLTLSNDSTLIYFCTSSYVTLNQLTLNRTTGQFQLAAAGTSSTYHNQLHNLDYASSGHTGFAGIEFGTTEYWNTERADYIPPAGMIVVYTDYQNIGDRLVPGIKIGDGNAYLINKPFIGEYISEILRLHLEDMTRHITEAERQKWNNKLNFIAPEIGSDLLIFNRN